MNTLLGKQFTWKFQQKCWGSPLWYSKGGRVWRGGRFFEPFTIYHFKTIFWLSLSTSSLKLTFRKGSKNTNLQPDGPCILNGTTSLISVNESKKERSGSGLGDGVGSLEPYWFSWVLALLFPGYMFLRNIFNFLNYKMRLIISGTI